MSLNLEDSSDEKLCIMIVGPGQDNVNTLTDLFLGANLNSVAVEINYKVLKKIETQVPDLILLNIPKPGVAGFRLCEELKSDPDLKNIPVILLSTETDTNNIQRGYKAGAIDFISNTCDPEELLIRVKSHLSTKLLLDELKAINKTKDKFLSLIAHDLRNPFTILLNFSEILYQNFDEFPDEKKKDYLKYIMDSTQQSYDLLENLLRWARSQSGIMEFYPTKINITEMIHENILFTVGYAQNKNLDVDFNKGKNVYVWADRNMIATVIRNLIMNAFKYTNPNGHILIETKTVNSFAEISFSDTGVGIDEERLAQLFRIDKKVKTAGTSQEGGTGLGLILCKEFIEKNDGKIWVKSEIGRGSQFTFSLPLAE